MMEIKPPVDMSQLEATYDWINQEQKRLEAEQARFKDLEEITRNVKELMIAFTEVSNADYGKSANDDEHNSDNWNENIKNAA